MTHAKIFAQGPYGAFELKRCFQKNMFMGTLISSSIGLLIIALLALISYLSMTPAVEDVSSTPIGITYTEIPPPTPLDIARSETNLNIAPDLLIISGIPNPVDATEIIKPAVIPTRLQKVIIANADTNQAVGIARGIYNVKDIEKTIIPDPEIFIARDDEPVLLNAPLPDYPDIARQAGITGHVWMLVYVDLEGNVADVRVQSSSNTSAGFEEAAYAAAWGRKYRPAMQNDQPVAVWISYKVSFKLSGY